MPSVCIPSICMRAKGHLGKSPPARMALLHACFSLRAHPCAVSCASPTTYMRVPPTQAVKLFRKGLADDEKQKLSAAAVAGTERMTTQEVEALAQGWLDAGNEEVKERIEAIHVTVSSNLKPKDGGAAFAW